MTRNLHGALAILLVLLLGLTGCAAVQGGAPSPAGSPADASAPAATATVDGSVQRVSVDLTKGYYDPTIINARAGMPLEIAFGQGQGCLASVLVPSFDVDQDLTSGGAVVRLPAMQPGEYEFSCGMRMVFGRIIVK